MSQSVSHLTYELLGQKVFRPNNSNNFGIWSFSIFIFLCSQCFLFFSFYYGFSMTKFPSGYLMVCYFTSFYFTLVIFSLLFFALPISNYIILNFITFNFVWNQINSVKIIGFPFHINDLCFLQTFDFEKKLFEGLFHKLNQQFFKASWEIFNSNSILTAYYMRMSVRRCLYGCLVFNLWNLFNRFSKISLVLLFSL